MAKILLIDDDTDHNRLVAAYLCRDGHVVDVVTGGDDAINLIGTSEYDVIILDWALPDMTGIDFLKQYRGRGTAPVIMLTGRGTIEDREMGLDSRADDYLVKPFSTRELSARVRALLRRPTGFSSAPLEAGPYALQPGSLSVTKNGTAIKLTPREFALLEFMMRHPNQIFKAEVLMSRVWRAESEATTDSLRTTIKHIRKKVDEGIIETVAGAGYKLGI